MSGIRYFFQFLLSALQVYDDYPKLNKIHNRATVWEFIAIIIANGGPPCAAGPRTCIGRKFATTEAICFLAALLRDYKIESVLRAGETRAEWRACVLDARLMLTLGVKDVSVTFVRRQT